MAVRRAKTSRITLGIDEAGRGPAIGPMVLAVVGLDTAAARALTRAGLRDSKDFGAGEAAHATRLELAARVRKVACYIGVHVVDVETIDARVACGELNVLEREVAGQLVDGAPPHDRIVADGKTMFRPLAARFPQLVAFDHGESQHAAVAAASVIAKTRRDEIYGEIRARYEGEYGPISGGGYVNDGTRRFLRAYTERHGVLPPEARRSWPHPYVADLLREPIVLQGRQLSMI
jgi:ribonuclease HII